MKEHLGNELIYVFIRTLSRAKSLGLIEQPTSLCERREQNLNSCFGNRVNLTPCLPPSILVSCLSLVTVVCRLAFLPCLLFESSAKGPASHLQGKQICSCLALKPGCSEIPCVFPTNPKYLLPLTLSS